MCKRIDGADKNTLILYNLIYIHMYIYIYIYIYICICIFVCVYISCQYTFQPNFPSRINHTGFAMGTSAESWIIFPLKPSFWLRISPWFPVGFPIVGLHLKGISWNFTYFPMIFPWFSHDFPILLGQKHRPPMQIPPRQEGRTVLMLSQLCQG